MWHGGEMRISIVFASLAIGAAVMVVGGQSANAQSDTSKPEEKGKKVVTIKNGDTLTKIAKDNKTTVERLFDANTKVKDPDIIHPGDKIRIPNKDEKLAHRELPSIQAVATSTYSNYSYSYSSQPKARISNAGGSNWDKLAACESGGNWSINTGNGYSGGLQFSQGTWTSNGGKGSPHTASKAEQIRVAENLRSTRGYSPWPACSAKLGLR